MKKYIFTLKAHFSHFKDPVWTVDCFAELPNAEIIEFETLKFDNYEDRTETKRFNHIIWSLRLRIRFDSGVFNRLLIVNWQEDSDLDSGTLEEYIQNLPKLDRENFIKQAVVHL